MDIGCSFPFHRKIQPEDEMVKPKGRDVILDRGTIKHTLEGAGISNSSVTNEQFGGLSDRGKEFNFVSLHINTDHNGDARARGTLCGPPPLLLQQRMFAQHLEGNDLLQVYNGSHTQPVDI